MIKVCGILTSAFGGGMIAFAGSQESAILTALLGLVGGVCILNGVMDLVREEFKEKIK